MGLGIGKETGGGGGGGYVRFELAATECNIKTLWHNQPKAWPHPSSKIFSMIQVLSPHL